MDLVVSDDSAICMLGEVLYVDKECLKQDSTVKSMFFGLYLYLLSTAVVYTCWLWSYPNHLDRDLVSLCILVGVPKMALARVQFDFVSYSIGYVQASIVWLTWPSQSSA